MRRPLNLTIIALAVLLLAMLAGVFFLAPLMRLVGQVGGLDGGT